MPWRGSKNKLVLKNSISLFFSCTEEMEYFSVFVELSSPVIMFTRCRLYRHRLKYLTSMLLYMDVKAGLSVDLEKGNNSKKFEGLR